MFLYTFAYAREFSIGSVLTHYIRTNQILWVVKELVWCCAISDEYRSLTVISRLENPFYYYSDSSKNWRWVLGARAPFKYLVV